ncbi:MAG: response regulator [Magnetococcales bacterium]|nr:response regulator [Magnetococcales bacterium]
MKVLIVDDQFENRKLLRVMLKNHASCDMVGNGMEAVEMFEGELLEGAPYDLVLLDIMMPGMDGQEALRKIRAIEREREITGSDEAKVIMITALDSPKQVIQAFFQGGCTDYLTKPITQKILLDKLVENDCLSAA